MDNKMFKAVAVRNTCSRGQYAVAALHASNSKPSTLYSKPGIVYCPDYNNINIFER